MTTQNVPTLSELGQLLRSMIEAIVDVPEGVQIVETNGRFTHRFDVQVDETDTGKVLGKRGDTINAMRTLVGVIGGRPDKVCEIRLVDTPITPAGDSPRRPSSISCELTVESARQLLERLVKALVDLPLRAEVALTVCTHLSVLEIRVNPANIRHVLGRQGRTITALRQLIRAISGKLHRPIYLHLIDDDLPASRELLEVAP